MREVDTCTTDTDVHQVELENLRDTFFVGEPGFADSAFVEVYGEAAASRSSRQVKILTFMRFDRFREALLQSPELEPCRRMMLAEGVHADLSEHGLGPGKAFVRADLACLVVQQIMDRGRTLRSSEVIVSPDFELLVLDLIQCYAPRALSREPQVEVWNIPCEVQARERHTFISCDALSVGSTSSVTRSTTDMHSSGANPRSRANRSSL